MENTERTIFESSMNMVIEKIQELRVIPVVQVDETSMAIPIVESLRIGGLPIAEITFRSRVAPQAIHTILEKYPDMLIGAGTVLNITQIKEAVAAGAKFIVSPGFSASNVCYCIENRIPVFPGVSTATEMMKAIEFGLHVVKFFPAETCGGINALKAFSAAFNELRFIPTGGLNEKNLKEYLDFPKVIACGESWMVKKELIDANNYKEIVGRTNQLVGITKGKL